MACWCCYHHHHLIVAFQFSPVDVDAVSNAALSQFTALLAHAAVTTVTVWLLLVDCFFFKICSLHIPPVAGLLNPKAAIHLHWHLLSLASIATSWLLTSIALPLPLLLLLSLHAMLSCCQCHYCWCLMLLLVLDYVFSPVCCSGCCHHLLSRGQLLTADLQWGAVATTFAVCCHGAISIRQPCCLHFTVAAANG